MIASPQNFCSIAAWQAPLEDGVGGSRWIFGPVVGLGSPVFLHFKDDEGCGVRADEVLGGSQGGDMSLVRRFSTSILRVVERYLLR
ncbi:MAG: hypothetical protein CMM07_21700 [Rhodopirellula sp.]|nr:hypothetical protein [Rhodopirellula sp.]